ncbi:hypothetical protein N0V85_005812, partial [Neurospora sp. IMI 360204]
CECKLREEKTEKAGDDELVARVFAVAQGRVVKDRVEEQRRIKEKRERSSGERRKKKGVFGWKEVTRFFGSSALCLSESESDSEPAPGAITDDHHKITDLCLACSNLDIDKIVAHLFTNLAPINGRCTITSSEVGSQPVETTPLFSVLRSPLFSTRPKGQTAILRLLLDLGADPNASVSVLPLSFESTHHLSGQTQTGRITALSAACILGMPEAVSLLLERGAKVDARETNLPLGVDGKWGKGLSALDVAILTGHGGQERIVEVLLRKGANVTGSCELFLPAAQLPSNKLAALAFASMILSSPYSKADTNARTYGGGRTPLHYAAQSLNLEVSSLLLSDPRTDPDVTDNGGATPLALLVGKLESACGGVGPQVAKSWSERGSEVWDGREFEGEAFGHGW